MSARAPLLASFFPVYLLLFGAVAVDSASAEDSAPVANHTDAEANPIDASITMQRPSHFRRGLKGHDWKKSKITRPSGNSRDGRRAWTHAKNGVVRNAIGLPVHPTSTDIKGTDVKASERAGVDGAPKSGSPAGNGGTEAGGIDTHRQGFVPLRAGGVTPHDPRTNTVMNHSIISGRDIVRPGLGAGAIGGPAKNVAGVISGNSFRPRHP